MKKWLLETKFTYRQWVSLAVLVSSLLGVLVYMSLSGAETAAQNAPKPELVKVVMAKQDIPEHTIIQENMLKVVEMPVDVVPAEAIQEIREVAGSPASVAIQQGDILTTKKVYADVRMAGFTGMIPPNCRAVSVAITDITGVSGFAKPGDYVDVMVVSGTRETGLRGEVLLQNVQLLGINRKGGSTAAEADKKSTSEENTDGDISIQGSRDTMATATLALPLDEALKVATASQKGIIYLVLRPVAPTDIFTVDTEYRIPAEGNAAVTPKVSAPVPAPAAAPAPTAPAVNIQPAPQAVHRSGVEIIRGTKNHREG
ncbi:MAG: Flp pilus assembly protein CpaB [Selenomonas sp.]|uniref:Flp pilus assembly protein CpaB n=1 Tax=Selenomonas sp. TaxID=2053611 RepID=UPI0025CF231C|nr:Flp pilus assembly protein CpaB [Selenomonas sp.]MCR5758492.1 Flp pilus assembly protein CpaB [Selenomonas sp.]